MPTLKLNRAVVIYKPSVGYSITAPAGTEVVHIGGTNGGYAIRNPRPYGVNEHDAKHYWFWVPADAVTDGGQNVTV